FMNWLAVMWLITGSFIVFLIFSLVSSYSFLEELSESYPLSRKYLKEGLHSICAKEDVKVLRNVSSHFTFIIGNGNIFDECIFHLRQFLSKRSATRFRDGFLELIVDLESIDNKDIIYECPDKFYSKLSVKSGRYRTRKGSIDAIRFTFDCTHPFNGNKQRTSSKNGFRVFKRKRKHVTSEKVFRGGSSKSVSSENDFTELGRIYDFASNEEEKNEWQMLQPASDKPAEHVYAKVRRSLQEKSGDMDDRISLSVLIYSLCAATMAVGILCFVLGICAAHMHLTRASADQRVAEREKPNRLAVTKEDAQTCPSLAHPDANDKKRASSQQESKPLAIVVDVRGSTTMIRDEDKAKLEEKRESNERKVAI
uniref:Uncharacterized protein n=1 Tax=Parascaris univalens TaxID=6257 RepID=A0A915BIS2_PARUN